MSAEHSPARQANGDRPITVSVARTAELTGLGVSTVWLYIKQGKLRTTSAGRRRLVFYASIEQLLGVDDKAA